MKVVSYMYKYIYLLEVGEAMIILEESQLSEYGFSISLEPRCVGVLSKPRFEKIKGELHIYDQNDVKNITFKEEN